MSTYVGVPEAFVAETFDAAVVVFDAVSIAPEERHGCEVFCCGMCGVERCDSAARRTSAAVEVCDPGGRETCCINAAEAGTPGRAEQRVLWGKGCYCGRAGEGCVCVSVCRGSASMHPRTRRRSCAACPTRPVSVVSRQIRGFQDLLGEGGFTGFRDRTWRA